MNPTILVCGCNSTEHQIVINYDKDDNELSCQIHLIKYGFFKRLISGIKHIFGYTSKYGDWDEFLFKKEHINQIKRILDDIELNNNGSNIKSNDESIILFNEVVFINEYKDVSNDYIIKILNNIEYYYLENDFILNLDKYFNFKIIVFKSSVLSLKLENNYSIKIFDINDKCVYLSKPINIL